MKKISLLHLLSLLLAQYALHGAEQGMQGTFLQCTTSYYTDGLELAHQHPAFYKELTVNLIAPAALAAEYLLCDAPKAKVLGFLGLSAYCVYLKKNLDQKNAHCAHTIVNQVGTTLNLPEQAARDHHIQITHEQDIQIQDAIRPELAVVKGARIASFISTLTLFALPVFSVLSSISRKGFGLGSIVSNAFQDIRAAWRSAKRAV